MLVDGANGACRRPAPRTDVTSALEIVVFAGLLVATTVLFTRPKAMRRTAVMLIAVACVLASSAPGLVAVWLRRADAPAHIADTSGAIARFVSQVERFSTVHGGCVEIVQRGCLACTPVLRYARPTVRECVAPRARVIVDDGALAAGCIERGDTLACGGVR